MLLEKERKFPSKRKISNLKKIWIFKDIYEKCWGTNLAFLKRVKHGFFSILAIKNGFMQFKQNCYYQWTKTYDKFVIDTMDHGAPVRVLPG